MKSIIFVTAFKNINKAAYGNNNGRSVDQYIEYFKLLASSIDYKLIVYVENDIRKRLETLNLKSNIVLHDYNDVNTFYNKYLETEKRIMSSNEYQNKVPVERKVNPEHSHPEYTLVNHNKVNFLSHTKKLYSDYDLYSWIDFGAIRNNLDHVPSFLNFNSLEDKISYMNLCKPGERISKEDMLKTADVYLTGTSFIVPSRLVEAYEHIYELKLLEFYKDNVCDDDQNVVLQIYYDHPFLFQLFQSSTWFTFFNDHLNTTIPLVNRYITFPKLIHSLDLTSNCIEIGVARGIFSKCLLTNTSIKKLNLIDPYENFSINEYTDAMNSLDMEYELSQCKENLSEFNSRIEFIRKRSSDAVGMFEDNSIDFCYIDGNHSYDATYDDIEKYYAKVKRGGILAGDDVYELAESKDKYYFWDGVDDINKSKSFGKYGVHNALVDFCSKHNLKYYIFDTQFVIFKV
jgi:hypothetical protein